MQVQSLEVISVNLWQVIISLCNLLIMFLILKKLLFGPVKKIMNQRREQVDRVYAEAEDSRTKANAMKAEYEASMANARQEADAVVKNATEAARRRSDEMISEASLQASHLRQKAEDEIAREKQQMLADVRNEISGIAVTIASKVVERDIDEKDCDRFVEEFIGNVGESK